MVLSLENRLKNVLYASKLWILAHCACSVACKYIFLFQTRLFMHRISSFVCKNRNMFPYSSKLWILAHCAQSCSVQCGMKIHTLISNLVVLRDKKIFRTHLFYTKSLHSFPLVSRHMAL